MLNRLYEGLFIFSEELTEEQLNQSVEAVEGELKKLGGSLEASTRLGKKRFARSLAKKKNGYYIIMVFRINGNNLDQFKKRLKLGTNVFRQQITSLDKLEEVTKEN